MIKPNDYMWVWDQNIEKVWICERTSDWPKWDLYRMEKYELRFDLFKTYSINLIFENREEN